jgi:antirestriction protein ArdC
MKFDTYDLITQRIIAKLESGTVPWKHFASSPLAEPKNFVSKKAYRGINHFLLSGEHSSDYWLTFKQALDVGGNVKRGEHSTPIVFWKFNEYEDKTTGEKKQIPFLRHYNVFNLDQTEGIDYAPVTEEKRVSEPLADAEALISGMPNAPQLVIDRIPKAYYSSSEDKVHMTERSLCVSDERFYEIIFHEHIHSTGHPSRLDRFAEEGNDHHFGGKRYATEELTAEMGAAFLCSHVGIFQTIENEAVAYLENWLGALKNDKTLIVKAAGKAQRAVDFILNRHVDSV